MKKSGGPRRRPRTIDDLLAVMRELGYEITRSRGGHWRTRAPDGTLITLPATPSDHRSILNAVARLRRHGLAL